MRVRAAVGRRMSIGRTMRVIGDGVACLLILRRGQMNHLANRDWIARRVGALALIMMAAHEAGIASPLYVGKITTSNQCVIDSHGIDLYDRGMSESPPGAPGGPQLHGPVARLLRPLVRLLIKSGVTFPALCELLRELYVNVAEYDFPLSDKSQTDSRVSLLTGIHRKEVRRLRGAGAPVNVVPTSLSRASQILARWLGAGEFTDETGRPLPLARNAREGEASFDQLVGSVTRDLRARAVLDEWLDRGLVRIDGEDRVVLIERALLPGKDDEQLLYYFGRNLHDHMAAAVANVSGEGPRFFERAVHYDQLSANAARKLEALSRDLATQALLAANREALAICDSDPGGPHRWNFGLYIFTDENEAPANPPSEAEGKT